MKCPNCHGEIEENLVTCSMCGYILDYERLDIDKDFDKSQRMIFLIKQNMLFIMKLAVLLFILVSTVILFIFLILDNDEIYGVSSYVFPFLIIIVCIALIILLIRGKRKW